MLISPRRTLSTTLALAASALLAAAPLAGAQSTTEADGAIAVSSLGSTTGTPGSLSGSLGSLASPAYADYVALGDSYAAFGDQSEDQSAGGPVGCARSLSNYPHLLDANPAVGDLTDSTCGGAVVPDILTRAQHEDAPAQITTIDEGTDLITLSIGGNDAGFSMIVGCITRQGPFATLPAATSCESYIGDDVSASIEATYGQDGPVDDVYDTIAERSPDATVIATQYMPLMPAEGTSCAFTESLKNPADVVWAREITEDINDAVAGAAERNGHDSVLPTDTVDRSACASAEDRWTDFLGGAPTNAAGFHPTALGQEAMAAAISAAL